MVIKDIMMCSVETIEPDESICEAAARMAAQNIGFLPVWQDGALLGVITDRDIVVRAVARGFDPEQTIVEEVMTSTVVSLPESSDIEDASELMESRHVRRLVVTDDKDMPVGIVSRDKIAMVLGVYAMDNGLVRDPPESPDVFAGPPRTAEPVETQPATRQEKGDAAERTARDQGDSHWNDGPADDPPRGDLQPLP
jgi:CBS domain-containing protein